MNNSIQYPQLVDVPLFAGFAEAERISFIDSCTLRSYPSATVLLHQDRPSAGMFIIASGFVNVYCNGYGGSTVMLNRCRPGDTLGEIESVVDRNCAATCEAAGAGTALFAPKSLLSEKLANVNFARSLMKVCYERMDRDNKSRALDMNRPLPAKLAHYLLMLSNSKREVRESQSYLASIISCSRQTINKELGALRDAGVLRLERGKITILSPDRLRAVQAEA